MKFGAIVDINIMWGAKNCNDVLFQEAKNGGGRAIKNILKDNILHVGSEIYTKVAASRKRRAKVGNKANGLGKTGIWGRRMRE